MRIAASLSDSDLRTFCFPARREVPNNFLLVMVGSTRPLALRARTTIAVALELSASPSGCLNLRGSFPEEAVVRASTVNVLGAPGALGALTTSANGDQRFLRGEPCAKAKHNINRGMTGGNKIKLMYLTLLHL